MDEETKDSNDEGGEQNDASTEGSADATEAPADNPAPADPSADEGWPEESAAADADSASADAAEQPTAEIPEEPTTARAAQPEAGSPTVPAATGGDRRVAAGLAAVLAVLLIGGLGYALGESSSSDLSAFDASPAAQRESSPEGDRWSPRGGGGPGEMGRGFDGDANCPDRG